MTGRGKFCLEDERKAGGDLQQPTAVLRDSKASQIGCRTLGPVQPTVIEGVLARRLSCEGGIAIGWKRGSDCSVEGPPCGLARD